MSPLKFLLFQLIVGIKSGRAIATIINETLPQLEGELQKEMRIWWFMYSNQTQSNFRLTTDHRQLMVEVLEEGLRGASVLSYLEELYLAVNEKEDQMIQSYLEKLPFKLLLPLLFCFFPAFLLLLFGPLVKHIYLQVLG